jgi:peptidyl-prolyl cis-trans isomerase D
VLHQMRSLAKYVWILVAIAFVGGFLLYQTSGLMGRTPVTASTAVAVVNGTEISYSAYQARVQNEIQSEQQRAGGRTLTEDDTRRIQNGVFDQMVSDVLLQDEYRRRGIVVTDDEVREFARYAPPPWILQAPELQTNGQFDPEKYGRLLGSAQARQGGLLVSLEQYYRTEIPREKLFDQISSGVYASNDELWRAWSDQHDSAQVSFVAFSATPDAAAAKTISDADLRAYFDKHKDEFTSQGHAVLSVLTIPRVVSAADSLAARNHAAALREEIVKGAKFEDVAKRESADSVSGQNGGDLGKQPKSAYVPEFSKAADALKVGEISGPVLSPFGYHIIRLDDRKGDTLALHHILVKIQVADSTSTRLDRKADSLSKMASGSEDGTKLDSAAKKLNLTKFIVQANEDQPASYNGRIIPSVSAWAFGGAKPGETSDLYDDESGYYLARLDSLQSGGDVTFENVKEAVRARLSAEREIDKLIPAAQKLAAAAATSTLEAAAQQAGKTVEKSPVFTRGTVVAGIGQYNEAIGAAFGLPVGAVSAPIRTTNGVYVIRVDKRVLADKTAWKAQLDTQRASRLQQLRQQKIQMYLQDIRKAAKVDDHRNEINAATRRAQA